MQGAAVAAAERRQEARRAAQEPLQRSVQRGPVGEKSLEDAGGSQAGRSGPHGA